MSLPPLFSETLGVRYMYIYWNIVDAQCYISFMSIIMFEQVLFYLFYVHHKCTSTCYHTTLLQYHWLYNLCFTFYAHDSFIPLSESLYLPLPFTYFTHLLTPFPSGSLSVSCFYGFLLFVYFFTHLICWLDSTYKRSPIVFVFLWLFFHLA